MKRSLLIIFLLPSIIGIGQKPEEIKKKYPAEDVVLYENSIEYVITLEQDQPKVTDQQKIQLLYQSEHSTALMSRYGFAHSSFNKVTQFEAYTKTAGNKKIKVTEFKTNDNSKNSIFYDDVKETNFDFPGISEGAYGVLELTTEHLDAHLLSPFYFTRQIPVINASLRIRFPKNMSVKYLILGRQKDKIAVTEESKKGETVYTFKGNYFEAEKRYADAPDDAFFGTHVLFYIEKFTNSKGTSQTYLSNIEDLHKLNYSHVQEINKTVSPELKRITDSLISGKSTEREKAEAIYRWVQTTIKYVAFEDGMGGFIPREANLVCSRKFGDCKDMSSILTVMLREAGLEAYYTWIGTRDIPYDYTFVATPVVDNHMICALKLGTEYIFLDGTDAGCIFGYPSDHIQGKQALICISESKYEIVRVPVPEATFSSIADSTYLELTDKGMKGTIRRELKGYRSMNFFNEIAYVNATEKDNFYRRTLNRGSNKFRITQLPSPEKLERSEVVLTAAFELNDYARKAGTDIFINLNLFKFFEHQEIDYPKRKIPIKFPFKHHNKYVVALKIPDGYQATWIPESKSYHNAVWGFDIKYIQKGNLLILEQTFSNQHMQLEPDGFQDWNKVLEQIYPLYKESIILSKK